MVGGEAVSSETWLKSHHGYIFNWTGKILMKGETISNWQKCTRWSLWVFSSPQFIIFNYLAQDVKLILTLLSGLLLHTDSECQTHQEIRNFPYSVPSDKGTTFFHSYMNGALQHHHPSCGSQSLRTWSKPCTSSNHTRAHGKTSAMQQGTWNTQYHLQNTLQSKWLCSTLLELNSMILVQIMWA